MYQRLVDVVCIRNCILYFTTAILIVSCMMFEPPHCSWLEIISLKVWNMLPSVKNAINHQLLRWNRLPICPTDNNLSKLNLLTRVERQSWWPMHQMDTRRAAGHYSNDWHVEQNSVHSRPSNQQTTSTDTISQTPRNKVRRLAMLSEILPAIESLLGFTSGWKKTATRDQSCAELSPSNRSQTWLRR